MQMNHKALAYQVLIFSAQWALMLVGLGLLSRIIAPSRLFEQSMPFGRILDAGIKALAALCLSVIWLFLWDRQVRFLFYRKNARAEMPT